MLLKIPAIFLSRIFRQMASAFRDDQFSILVEKLRKKRYSFIDMTTKNLIEFQIDAAMCCSINEQSEVE